MSEDVEKVRVKNVSVTPIDVPGGVQMEPGKVYSRPVTDELKELVKAGVLVEDDEDDKSKQPSKDDGGKK